MNVAIRQAITVGVDRSLGGKAAVLWAANAAHLRGVPLHIINVYHCPMTELRAIGDGSGGVERLRLSSLALLEQARDAVRARWPGVQVVIESIEGHPAAVFRDRAEPSLLLVVGRHGPDASDRLIGSVATTVASHATRPCVVVPPSWGAATPGPVIVGVNGRHDIGPTVEFGLDYAHRAGVTARFIVCRPNASATQPEGDRFPAAWAERIRHVAGQFPGVAVRTHVISGEPASVLAGQAAPQDLLVLGRRHELGPLHRLFGSVVTDVMRRASCPVAVIPDAAIEASIPVEDQAADRRLWASEYGFSGA